MRESAHSCELLSTTDGERDARLGQDGYAQKAFPGELGLNGARGEDIDGDKEKESVEAVVDGGDSEDFVGMDQLEAKMMVGVGDAKLLERCIFLWDEARSKIRVRDLRASLDKGGQVAISTLDE
ncbi:MAG: hypothetical protein Q9187_006747 [Circinaria calcarea]